MTCLKRLIGFVLDLTPIEKLAEEEGFVRPQAYDSAQVIDSKICTICKNRAQKQLLAALTYKLATAIPLLAHIEQPP
jgi:hypothetical protein